MSDNDIAFLAEMILKLVPLGDKMTHPDGKQASQFPRFSVEEVKRLADIRPIREDAAPAQTGEPVAHGTIHGATYNPSMGKWCAFCGVYLGTFDRGAHVCAPAPTEEGTTLTERWRRSAQDSLDEASRIRRTVGHLTDAETRCVVRAECWKNCADELAALRAPAPDNRAIICVYCGVSVKYDAGSYESARNAAIAHDAVCPKNPHVHPAPAPVPEVREEVAPERARGCATKTIEPSDKPADEN